MSITWQFGHVAGAYTETISIILTQSDMVNAQANLPRKKCSFSALFPSYSAKRFLSLSGQKYTNIWVHGILFDARSEGLVNSLYYILIWTDHSYPTSHLI